VTLKESPRPVVNEEQVHFLLTIRRYCKSVDLFGLKSYLEIKDHPDFHILKKQWLKYKKRKDAVKN